MPAEIHPLTQENKTKETLNVPMNKPNGVLLTLTESISESSQDPPIIHAEDTSQTTESPLEKGPLSTTELVGLSVTGSVESVDSEKSPVDEIPLSEKCNLVGDCNDWLQLTLHQRKE